MQKEVSFEEVVLEGGEFLPKVNLKYSTYGTLNKDKNNVVWVCHALTGDNCVHDWWSCVFGKHRFLDPEKYFIVCANVLGSCYGSTGPSSDHLPNGYERNNFPTITIRDMISVHKLLASYLGIGKIKTIIGPSLGGQQTLEWACEEPDRFENVCVIASNARHSPWGIAFNESQRQALWSDPTFRSNFEGGGKFGLKAARSIALLSYRSYDCYNTTQSEHHNFKIDNFNASSYQQYQGDKIVGRFCPYSYWTLSKAMDSHNIARDRGGIRNALSSISGTVLAIGVDTDLLFPVSEQEEIANLSVNGIYRQIKSIYGHDGFLLEGNQLNPILMALHDRQLKPTTNTRFKSNFLN